MASLVGFSDADLQQRLESAAERRPRLAITSSALSEDPVQLRNADVFLAPARELLDTPVLTRVMEGRRLLAVSRQALWRLGCLSVAWMRTRDEAFLRRAESELQAVCSFSDWNPSHYLDTAEMMLAVSLAYDWLYDDLSPACREATAESLWRLGLQTALDDSQGWVTAHNNWGQVCQAGVLAASIALSERHPEEAFRLVRRAFHNLPLAMEAYQPDGVYPEGPMYWDYGTSFNIAFLMLAESALGTSYGLAEWPGFARSAEFLLHATGPTGQYFDFADCHRNPRRSLFLSWFSARYGLPLPDDSPEADAFRSHPERYARNRLAPLVMVFGPQTARFAPASDVLPLDWTGGGPSAMAAFRSGWTTDAWYLGVKGGTPSANHGHMDVGGFVLEARGQRWAEDAGMEDYHRLESRGYNLWNNPQDGLRWGVFRYGVESHNLSVIDGGRQNVKGHAAVEVAGMGGASPEARLDLSELYGVAVTRRFVFEQRAAVSITDDFAGLRKGASVRWQMLTKAEVETDGADLVLRRGGQSLRVSNEGRGAWTVEEAPSLLQEWDSPMDGYRRIRFECAAPEEGDLRIAVRFE